MLIEVLRLYKETLFDCMASSGFLFKSVRCLTFVDEAACRVFARSLRSRRDVRRHRRSSEETLCGSGSGAAARSHESELGELVQDPGAAGSFLVCIPASERSAVRRRRAGGAGGAGAHRRSGEHHR